MSVPVWKRSRHSWMSSGHRAGIVRLAATLAVVSWLPVDLHAVSIETPASVVSLARRVRTRLVSRYGRTQDDLQAESGAPPDTLVAAFRSCIKQGKIYVGEAWTLQPEPVDALGEFVSCADEEYATDNPAVATVTSWGEVDALAPGVAHITIESGIATRTVAVTVLEGARPYMTDEEWQQQNADDCQEPALNKTDTIDVGEDPVAGRPDTASPDNAIGTPHLNAMEYPSQTAIGAHHNFGSSNYSFSAPLLSLGGREEGLDLALTYNGQLWEKDMVAGTSTPTMTFNYGKGWPAAGWRLGFGRIIESYDGPSSNNVLLIEPDGTKVPLIYDAASGKCLSQNGTFLEYGPGVGRLKYPNGTIVVYEHSPGANNRRLPTSIESPNGNIIVIQYKGAPYAPWAIDTIKDTLGRVASFHYYGDAASGGYQPPPGDASNPTGALYSIRVADRGSVPGSSSNLRELVRIGYTSLGTLPANLFTGVTVDAQTTPVTAVAGIYYPATGTGYTFEYASPYAMATTIHVRKDMTGTTGGTDVARAEYGFPTTVQPLSNPPRFQTRTEWRDNGSGSGITASYDYGTTTGTGTKQYTVTATSANPDRIVTVTTVGTTSENSGLVLSSEIYKNDASVPANRMRRVAYTYLPAPAGSGGIWGASNGGHVVHEVTTTNESNEKSKVTYSYTGGSFGQVRTIDEYDFTSTSTFVKLRGTSLSYLNTWTATNYKQNLFYLVTNATVSDEGGTVRSKSVLAYDVYPLPLKNYLLEPPKGTRDATYDVTTYAFRGNLTSTTRYQAAATNGGPITKNQTYDIYGNVVTADVNCCSLKVFAYDGQSNGVGLYFSQPLSITDGPTGGPTLTHAFGYDFANGQVLTATDERGHQTTYTYDAAWRPRTITDPSVDNETPRNVVRTFNYDVGSPGKDQLVRNDVLTYFDNGTQRTVTSQVWLDGMGHVVRQGTNPPSSGGSFDTVRMVYDAIGRMSTQTNPYAGDANGNPTGVIYSTSYSFDALSRVTTITLPDANTIATAYAGKMTTVTDQVNRKRQTIADGLGRLKEILEQNPETGELSWRTDYGYDVFDNVTDVKMYKPGGTTSFQERTASYDGLSRLVSRTTPEVNNQTDPTVPGTPVAETFTYFDFDAVHEYTDGRGAKTTYGYDPLNRLNAITYTTQPGVAATESVAITYELTNAQWKGLVTSVTDYRDGATPHGETYAYESNTLGRLRSRTRSIGMASQSGGLRAYTVTYSYNSIGAQLSLTYPGAAALKVKMEHDGRGRLSGVTNFATGTKYLTAITYNAASLVEGFNVNDNGTNKVVEDYNYSPDRLQLTNQSVTKSSSGASYMNFNYSYAAMAGASGTGTTAGNSGQLMGIVNGSRLNGQSADQNFTYDNVGRLLTSTGSSPGDTNKGTDTPGTFVAASSFFFLRNSNSAGAADIQFAFGIAPSTWVPIKGDWDGDGIDTVGLYDPSTSTFHLRNTNSAGPRT